MDGTSSNMYWIVAVVVVITLLFVIFKVAFPQMGDKIMDIINGQIKFASDTADGSHTDKPKG